jgi:methylenetetrahydrofolate reductase (NADPH)
MCGTCILPKTAFVCPMTCPRGLRNGPCRGSSQHRCFVNPSCRCTWFDIYQHAEQQGDLEELLEVNAPLDNGRLGCETLLSTYRLWRQQNQRPNLPDLIKNRPQFDLDRHAFSYSLRQPDWWQGDSQYHPPKYVEPVSRLEARLRAGHFAITAEVAPPREPTSNRISQVARCLKGFVDTLNFTDNPLGVARVSALACALQSLQRRLEPVLQLQTRHRSRYDIAAEVAGAAAVGVRNILCLTDDIGRLGPGPRPRPERNDLDAVQALWMLRRLRDEGIDVDGRVIEHPPQYFLGAIASPYAALPRYEAVVSEKKINAGAQFLQTLPIFDLVRFTAWLEALDKRDLLGKVYLMPTVTLFKSPRHARFAANEVPGVYIPVSMMTRLENAADTQEEGIEIALNLIAHLKDMGGVHGLHILAPGLEEVVPRLVKESSLDGSISLAGRGTFCFSKNGGNKPSANKLDI